MAAAINPAIRWLMRALLVTLAAVLLSACVYRHEIYSGKGLFGEVTVYDDPKGLRVLEFGRGTGRQTVMKVGDPAHLELEYVRIALIALALINDPPRRVLVIGLGGGALPQFLRMAYPATRIDVAEIDPAVVTVAERYFDLRQDDHLRVHVSDGRAFIESAAAGSYDIVFLDAFGSSSVPRHLTTLEFLHAVRRVMRPEGVMVSNVWGPDFNPMYHDMLSTHRAGFQGMYLVYAPNDVNVMVFAHAHAAELNQAQLAARARTLGQPPLFRYDLGGYVERAWLDVDPVVARGHILRDPRQ